MLDGFWSHRGSNDLIYVVTADPDWLIQNFGVFLQWAMRGSGVLQVHPGSNYNPSVSIAPHWESLISIEVQTKKYLTGHTEHLHVKFYFDERWARHALGSAFRDRNYERNLRGIAEYWDDEGVSHANVVFDGTEANRKLNTIVTPSIVRGLDVLGGYSLPRNKNVYIVTDAYRSQIKDVQRELV